MTKRKGDKYENKRNAVCIVLYDLAGNNVPEDMVNRLLDQANKIAKESETLAINFTRT